MYFQRIKHLREEFEYTQDYVAKYLGCNRSTYANWETGNIIIPLDVASKLAILYSVPLSFILGVGTIHSVHDKIKIIDHEYMRKKLNELKANNNDSYEKISRYINNNRSTTNRYFNGKVNIPTDKLILLCEYYNVDVDELCGTK
ncbi:MAG: helix-turn-helix domain-containing protein [Bacilli bacterium]